MLQTLEVFDFLQRKIRDLIAARNVQIFQRIHAAQNLQTVCSMSGAGSDFGVRPISSQPTSPSTINAQRALKRPPQEPKKCINMTCPDQNN